MRKHILIIALETGIHWRTVQRWLNGQRVSPATEYACRSACEKLGIAPPEKTAVAAEGAA